MNSASLKRVKAELAEWQQQENPYQLRLSPKADPREYLATVKFEAGVFQELVLEVVIQVPVVYPFKPPKLFVISPVRHVYLDKESGHYCCELLTDKWTPIVKLQAVLDNFKASLSQPLKDIDPVFFADLDYYINPAAFEPIVLQSAEKMRLGSKELREVPELKN